MIRLAHLRNGEKPCYPTDCCIGKYLCHEDIFMHRILVEPNQLRRLSKLLLQTADELRSVAMRLGGTLSGLDFEVRQRVDIESDWITARNHAQAAAEVAEELASYLAASAVAFEDADSYSLAALEDAIRRSRMPMLVPTSPNEGTGDMFPPVHKREHETGGG